MTGPRKRIFSAVLGVALLATMLLLSSLNTVPARTPPKNTVLKDVHMYVPPPPPPVTPPPQKRSNSASGETVQIDMQRKSVELGRMTLDNRLASAHSVPVMDGVNGLGLSGYGAGGIGNGLGGSETLVNLEQLDSNPMVVNSPSTTPFINYLTKKKMKQLRVVFRLRIDENGKTYAIRIIESPAPELNAEFLEYAKQATFTPPRSNGRMVRIEHRWPVMFTQKTGSP